MKIRFLGTGYGECKVKKKCSFDLRRRGGVVIDERIIIDAPADIFDCANALGFSEIFKTVSEVFISHSHSGHFSVEALEKLSSKRKIRVFASGDVLALIPENPKIEVVELLPFMPIELAEYRILPLPANHVVEDSAEVCFNFVISKEKTLFYALDGGGINLASWNLLKQEKIDMMIMDCALENRDYSAKNMQHSNLQDAIRQRSILKDAKVCGDDTKFILCHIPTDRRRSIHEELSEVAKSQGFTVAYDGYFTIC